MKTMLKKISMVLCAGLFAVTFTSGCKKDEKSAGGGCDGLGTKMKAQMASEMPKDVPADMKKSVEEMGNKMADMLVKHCKDDKWSADVVKCGNEAKDPKKECMGKLTAEQQKKLEDDMMKAMGGMGMGMPKDEPKDDGTVPDDQGEGSGTAAGTGSGTGEGSGTAAGTGSGTDENVVEEAKEGEGEGSAAVADSTGLPNCDALIAAYGDLAKCDKMPKESRDAMAQGLESMKQGWGDLSAADDATKKAMDDGCKQGVDALKQTMSASGC
jgi:hypothetical protein